MILAQLTDTHIKKAGHLAYRRVDTSAFLLASITHLNKFIPAVDAVIITGDFTDVGTIQEYQILYTMLKKLEAPWFIIPGNHDNRQNLLEVFKNQVYLSRCTNYVQYTVEHFPVQLIGLDTVVPGQPHGLLCQDRLSWLKEQLKKTEDKITILFQHHPPFRMGVTHMDVQNLQNASEEIELVKKFTNVRHIACGHAHRASETCIDGIGVSIAPNGAHSVTLDLKDDAPPAFSMDPPSIRIFWISDKGAISSHISFVGEFDGPYPFFSKDGTLID